MVVHEAVEGKGGCMGRIDAVTNQYFKNNAVFADAVNYALHDGKPVIQPERLRDLDTTLYLSAGDFGKREQRRTRDVTNAYTAKEDPSNVYLILSAENQSHTSLIMPVRTMLGDAIQYMDQIRQKTAEYDALIQKKEFAWEDTVEKLSGIRYGDRLKPVITIVVHWEGTPWRGPRSLHDMLIFEEEWVKNCVPDWPLYLLDAAEVEKPDQRCFRSDLGRVLYLVQSDRRILKEIEEGRHETIELSSDAKRVVKEITGLKIPEKGVTEVTNAVREYLEEIRVEERKEGREEGREENLLGNIRSLIANLKRPAEEVMDLLDIPKNERAQYLAKL